MSDETQEAQQPVQDRVGSMKANLSAIEQVRDLFALSHDIIMQASHPGHLAAKVQAAAQFLAFQHKDFSTRAETLKKSIESIVDVPAAKEAVAEALNGSYGHQTHSASTPNE